VGGVDLEWLKSRSNPCKIFPLFQLVIVSVLKSVLDHFLLSMGGDRRGGPKKVKRPRKKMPQEDEVEARERKTMAQLVTKHFVQQVLLWGIFAVLVFLAFPMRTLQAQTLKTPFRILDPLENPRSRLYSKIMRSNQQRMLQLVEDPEVRSDWMVAAELKEKEDKKEGWEKDLFFNDSISQRTRSQIQQILQSEEEESYTDVVTISQYQASRDERQHLLEAHAKDMIRFHIKNLNSKMKEASQSSFLGKAYSTQKSIENASRVEAGSSDVHLKSKFDVQTLTNQLKFQTPVVNSELRFRLAPGLFGDEFEKNNPVTLRLEREFQELAMEGEFRYGFQNQKVELEWKKKILDNLYGVAGAHGENGGGDSLEGVLRVDYRLYF